MLRYDKMKMKSGDEEWMKKKAKSLDENQRKLNLLINNYIGIFENLSISYSLLLKCSRKRLTKKKQTSFMVKYIHRSIATMYLSSIYKFL